MVQEVQCLGVSCSANCTANGRHKSAQSVTYLLPPQLLETLKRKAGIGQSAVRLAAILYRLPAVPQD